MGQWGGARVGGDPRAPTEYIRENKMSEATDGRKEVIEKVYEDYEGNRVEIRRTEKYRQQLVNGKLIAFEDVNFARQRYLTRSPLQFEVELDRLESEVELLRARLDASTRSTLHVEPLDVDPQHAIVASSSLETAHGVARRNREDLELGDDY